MARCCRLQEAPCEPEWKGLRMYKLIDEERRSASDGAAMGRAGLARGELECPALRNRRLALGAHLRHVDTGGKVHVAELERHCHDNGKF